MTYFVTTDYTLSQVTPPNLPLAPGQYNPQYQEQLNNVLRLYFNQLNKIVAQLQSTQPLSAGSSLQFPNGAFFQDGVTTLTTGISNVSTTPIVVADTSQFVLSSGGLIIGTEIIGYTGKTATTFTGITRGMYGSTKAAHTAGAVITEAQTLSSPAIATALAQLQTTSSNGVSINTTDRTKIDFAVDGIYNVAFSVQMLTYDTVIDNVTIWWRQNGVDIPYSAGIATVPSVHGGIAGTAIISWNLVLPINAGDNMQLMFASDTGNTVCATYPAGTVPVHPVSPSVIVTATFVSALY
jgi:hypothetical protein